MRLLSCALVILACLIVTGCNLFSKQPKDKAAPATPPPGGDPRMPWPPPAAGRPGSTTPPNWPAATPASVSGILAGQILDGFNRPPPTTVYIQVVMTQGDKGAPIEVAADDQGYFTIQGLSPGKPYRLIARAKYGEKLLAGTSFATPPNPRVVIRIGEEHASADTPPPPPPPTMPDPRSNVRQPPAVNWQDTAGTPAWSPVGPGGAPRPAGLGAPVPASAEEPPPPATLQPPVPPAVPYRPEDIAGRGLARNDAPPVSIPGPGRSWAPADNEPLRPIAPPVPPGPAPVPSCVLVGRQLHNLALYDLDGRPWEFRDHRARLTLIDFWGTWCVHCLHSIPHLNMFQERYGPYGLQVVGIAYEDGPPQIQADKVRRVAQRTRIDYQLLLGGERLTCPVRSQFGVASWPTLVLLDDSGRIIWKSVGLQPQALTELDAVIRQQLGAR